MLGVGHTRQTGQLLRRMQPDQVRGIPLEPTTPQEVDELVRESGLGAHRFRLPISLELGLSAGQSPA